MKLRHLLTGAILTVSLFAATAIIVLVAAPKERFKTVNSAIISGWAYNSSTPDDALNVWISIKDKNISKEVSSQRMIAGEYSDELYGSGKGNDCHALTLNVDWSALLYGVYLVEGYVRDSDFSNPRTCTNGNPDARQETPAAEAQNLVPLGVFKTTGYCPCGACSEGWGRRTNTGAMTTAGHTIAVDPRVIPYGSKVMISGVAYTVEDRDGAFRDNHIDIFLNTHAGIRQYDTQNAEVYLVQS